jgi:hypothetical protein
MALSLQDLLRRLLTQQLQQKQDQFAIINRHYNKNNENIK